MRNVVFKMLRTKVDGRFHVGKNKVMAVALGSDAASECIPGGSLLAQRLKGDCGILFTNESREALEEKCEAVGIPDYARTGSVVDTTVIVMADPTGLRNVATGELLSGTLEVQMRSAGMPTKLQGGLIMLVDEKYQICAAGDRLNVDQARLLKAMGIKLATFKVNFIGHLTGGTYTDMDTADSATDGSGDEASEQEETI